MFNARETTRIRKLAFAFFLASALAAVAQDMRMSENNKAALSGAVEVELSTDRKTYVEGDRVMITGRVKNTGSKPIYVFPHTGFEIDGDGVFIVRVLEAPKCKAVGHGGAGTPAPPDKTLKFSQWVSSHWLLLTPGAFIGKTQEFTMLSPLCPGKYTLGVTYLTELFWWSGERIQASEAELRFPAVYGAYKGNPVTFRILQKK